MKTVFIFVICVAIGFVLGYLIDRYFYKPSGELIFKKINEDEASVSVKLYEDGLYETVNAKKVVMKVTRE